MTHPHFVSSVPALTYDSKNDRVVRVLVSVDDKGRRWESYDGGPDTLIASPEEPENDSNS